MEKREWYLGLVTKARGKVAAQKLRDDLAKMDREMT
jgi:hypothetical protein